MGKWQTVRRALYSPGLVVFEFNMKALFNSNLHLDVSIGLLGLVEGMHKKVQLFRQIHEAFHHSHTKKIPKDENLPFWKRNIILWQSEN